jgi:outer membrane protein OmpA-like peptidoglycan-associated protein
MKIRIYLILLLIFCVRFSIFSQNQAEKATFDDAEYFFMSESYTDALASYLKLAKRTFKDNANINYRIGICYLNSTIEKTKAVPYLEKAVTKTTDKYQEGSIKETSAPYDAYLFLGNAYRINNDLDKAITSYNKYISLTTGKKEKEDEANRNWAKAQIENCKRAKTAMQNAIRVKLEVLPKPINTSAANFNPVSNASETKIIFITQQKFYDAVMETKFLKNKWTSPDNITPDIQSDGNQYPCFLSDDGNTLLLNKIDNDNSDIYISKFNGKIWGISEPIGKGINTKYWESHACLSADGKTIYFTSNRPQSLGGTDIFVSTIGKNNQWQEPQNLGNVINTPFNEETPFLSADGNTLYFSSQGHDNIGGYDIFYSTKDANGNWSKPKNMGYPISTTDDDLFYVPLKDKNFGFQAKYVKNGIGDLDLVKIETFSKEHPFKYDIQGNLKDNIKDAKNENYTLILTDVNGNKIDSLKPSNSGSFSFKNVAGSYKLKFASKDFTADSKQFTIPENYPQDAYILTSESLGISDQYNKYINSKKEQQTSQQEKAGKVKVTEVSLNSSKAAVINNILFQFDDFTISKDAEKEISNIVKIMKENPSLELEIIGYTDSQGKDRYNNRLSEKRAKSIKELLTDAGIKSNRISTKGLGKSSPISVNENPDGSDNPEGRSYNRRVEFRILKCDNKNISIAPISVPEKLRIKTI